jgi:hypothetical protein
MNETKPVPNTSRRPGRWVWISLGVLLTPVVGLGVLVYSLLTLNANAASLRREVAAATQADLRTKVQLDVGWMTLGAIRSILHFVHHEHIDEARLALAAVRKASVGVYEWSADQDQRNPQNLFTRTDQMMNKRGLSRLVGVTNARETVLVYASENRWSGSSLDLCVAVLGERELVIVSSTVNADALAELVQRQLQQKSGGLSMLALN